MNKRLKSSKRIIIGLWIMLIITAFVGYLFFPKIFRPETIIYFIENNYLKALIIFSAFVILRGFILISPLIITLASLAIFDPLTAFLINTIGIIISSFLVYKAAKYLDVDDYLEIKYGKKIKKIKKSLEKKEIPIITAWSFFPFFPTDLIVYASASLKIPLWKCLLGIFIGTLLINAISIYSLSSLLEYYKIF
ncbi:MAG: VTT domain-containing protein [Candidatus Pacebacteria bacterium]|nr:VTT domain-containing protein [Candidatus Paceibacterota bacterium]